MVQACSCWVNDHANVCKPFGIIWGLGWPAGSWTLMSLIWRAQVEPDEELDASPLMLQGEFAALAERYAASVSPR